MFKNLLFQVSGFLLKFKPFLWYFVVFFSVILLLYIKILLLERNLSQCDSANKQILLKMSEARVDAAKKELAAKEAIALLQNDYELKLNDIKAIPYDKNKTVCDNAMFALRSYF